ncbi:hypothetical protein CTAYLR_005136 [Chrysophaeum taylorii]|uniref:Uncharacterized protein n=1 Tax=Chrysophaeum taylorii TaxID=2483200 RepID=A0AAD7UDZ9_9STRA|nr:hypothetical protein CTAYLR_005136 [Chrysophaeum taylorii]
MRAPTDKADRLLSNIHGGGGGGGKTKKRKPPKGSKPLLSLPPPREETTTTTTTTTVAEEPPTALGLLRRLARAVEQVNDDETSSRRTGLETLCSVFLEGPAVDSLPEPTLAEMLNVLSRPLLRRFEDHVERHREMAIAIYTRIVERVVDVGPHLPYVFPVLMARGSRPDFDEDLGLFVFDAEAVEAFKRGKAIQRPDFDMALERERVLRVREPSEELRLLSCRLLLVVVLNPARRGALASFVAYLEDAVSLLAGAMRDPFADLLACAADGIAALCQIPPLHEFLVGYATALARVVMPSLRHRHAKVRSAVVHALHRAVAVRHEAKCRGAGTDAISDLVAFREENVIPTASFYEPELRYNYLADLTRDASALVRRRAAECLADWFTTLPDRRDHQPRLMAYVLNYAIDEDDDVRSVALWGIETAGREFADEERSDRVIDRLQYGVDGDERANHDPAGLPWPFERRPSLGARLIVRAFAYRIIQPTLDELANWRSDARRQSALLLRVIVVYTEDHLTQDLYKIVVSLCRALRVIRREAYEHRDLVLDCCRTLGRYVVPESVLQFLTPRIQGDIELMPGGTDSCARADVMSILGALLRGAKASTLLAHTMPLVNLLTHDKLARCEDPNLRIAVLEVLDHFLGVLSARGRATLEATFVTTGRLDTLDAAISSLLRAVLALRGGAMTEDAACRTTIAQLADGALLSLASIDADFDPATTEISPVTKLVLHRCPRLIDEAISEEHDMLDDPDSYGFRIVEQSLLLVIAVDQQQQQQKQQPLLSQITTTVACGKRSEQALAVFLRGANEVAQRVIAVDHSNDDAVYQQILRRFSDALLRPLNLASRVHQDAKDSDVASVAANMLRDFTLATRWNDICAHHEGFLWIVRSKLLVLLTCPTGDVSLVPPEVVTPQVAAKIVGILAQHVSNAREFRRRRAHTKGDVFDETKVLRAIAHLLSTCHPKLTYCQLPAFEESTMPEHCIQSAAKHAHRTVSKLFLDDDDTDDKLRDVALDIMWEVVWLVRDDATDTPNNPDSLGYSEFVADLLPMLPPDIDDTTCQKNDSFGSRLDALLRATAVRDPEAFKTLLARHVEANRRTSVLSALQEHAGLLCHLASRKKTRSHL